MGKNETTIVNINYGEIKKDINSINTLPPIAPITTQESYAQASDLLKVIKSKLKELEDKRKSITKPLDESKKQIMDLFRPAIETLEAMETKIKNLMVEYTTEQVRKAKEKEESYRQEMMKNIEKIKQGTQKELDKALAKGNTEKVEELKIKLEHLEDMPLAIPSFHTPEIEHKGISYREKWYAEVVDFSALPDEYKLPNMQALDKVAQATKGSAKISGVIFKSEKIVVSR